MSGPAGDSRGRGKQKKQLELGIFILFFVLPWESLSFLRQSKLPEQSSWGGGGGEPKCVKLFLLWDIFLSISLKGILHSCSLISSLSRKGMDAWICNTREICSPFFPPPVGCMIGKQSPQSKGSFNSGSGCQGQAVSPMTNCVTSAISLHQSKAGKKLSISFLCGC